MKASWTFVLAWLLAVAAVAEADAQTGPYPNKPVQIITDSSAGSTCRFRKLDSSIAMV